MGSKWNFVLVEEVSNLPVRWQPPRPERRPPRESLPIAALLGAVSTLMRRGSGPRAWVSSVEHDPVAFLMDAIDAPVRLWSADGRVLYQNPAAGQPRWAEMSDREVPAVSSREVAGQQTIYRRVLRFQHAGERYTLEIVNTGAEE